MRACIIGAGAGGLCAARHMTRNLPPSSTNLRPVVYEQSDQVGGVWVYDEETNDGKGKCEYHHQFDNNCSDYWRTCMYKNLRTNLPKELMMAFPDFPFPDSSLPSYIGHVDVKGYLRQYADHFGLYQLIKFRHKVLQVARNNSNQLWLVTVKNLLNGECESEEFDAIFVCNGHNSKPHVPSIPNADQFEGRLMHSCEYRTGNQFSDLRVACLGAGPSGMDIGMDICKYAKTVSLCHKGPSFTCPLPENMIQTPVIREFTKNGIIVSGVDDGDNSDIVDDSTKNSNNKKEELEVDAVVLCTGYKYDFPFLRQYSTGGYTGVGLTTNDDGFRVSPLFQHVVNIHQPTMFFIGLNQTIVPFPTFDTQVQFAISILSGNFKLPTSEEMLEWERRDYEHRTNELGLPPKKAHFLGLGDMWWEYLQGLARLANFPLTVPPGSNKLFQHVREVRGRDVIGYHNINYTIEGDDFVIL